MNDDKPTKKPEICANCRWFHEKHMGTTVCRRYPPASGPNVHLTSTRGWPIVLGTDVCGEFRRNGG